MLTGSCHCGEASPSLKDDRRFVTACNCTLCSRYGALWAYDYENERSRLTGPMRSSTRAGKKDPTLEILFFPSCGGVLCWRGLSLEEGGRRRMAVDLRLPTIA